MKPLRPMIDRDHHLHKYTICTGKLQAGRSVRFMYTVHSTYL